MSDMQDTCPSQEELLRFYRGKSEDFESWLKVAQHLGDCPNCRNFIENSTNDYLTLMIALGVVWKEN